jgi:hypothetical protein
VAPALGNRRRRTTSPAAPVVTGDLLLTPSQSQAAASRWAARGSSDPVILTLQPPRLHYSGRPIGAAGCRARDTYGSGDAVAAGVQPRPAEGGGGGGGGPYICGLAQLVCAVGVMTRGDDGDSLLFRSVLRCGHG